MHCDLWVITREAQGMSSCYDRDGGEGLLSRYRHAVVPLVSQPISTCVKENERLVSRLF